MTQTQLFFLSFPLQMNRTSPDSEQPPASEPVWERPWSVEEIRRSSQNWSLAADAGVSGGPGAKGGTELLLPLRGDSFLQYSRRNLRHRGGRPSGLLPSTLLRRRGFPSLQRLFNHAFYAILLCRIVSVLFKDCSVSTTEALLY